MHITLNKQSIMHVTVARVMLAGICLCAAGDVPGDVVAPALADSSDDDRPPVARRKRAAAKVPLVAPRKRAAAKVPSVAPRKRRCG